MTEEEIELMTEEEQETYYEELREELERLFPDVGFSLGIELEDLDIELSTLDRIIVKNTSCCCCYAVGNAPPSDYIEVIKPEGQTHITYRTVIQKLNDIRYEALCNHNHLEVIQLTKNTEMQFELGFSS